jgi:hypothetical protein
VRKETDIMDWKNIQGTEKKTPELINRTILLPFYNYKMFGMK